VSESPPAPEPLPATDDSEDLSSLVDLYRQDLSSLKDLYRKAVRLPLTPYMINQIQGEQRDDFLAELRYYSSVDIEVTHQYGAGPSLRIETQPLRDVRDEWSIYDDLEVSTFREGDLLGDRNRISREEGGQLVRRSPAGNVFEIQYSDRPFILGFVLDPEKHWYNLEFALDKAEGKRIPLIMTGPQPRLTINYRIFFTTQEARIQLMDSPDLPGRQGGYSDEAGLPPYVPPEVPGRQEKYSDEAGPPPYVPPKAPARQGGYSDEAEPPPYVPPKAPARQEKYSDEAGPPPYVPPKAPARRGGYSDEAEPPPYVPPKAPAGVPNGSPKGDPAAGGSASHQTENLMPAGSLRSLDDVPRWDRWPSSGDRILIEDGDAYVPEVVFVESPSKSLIPVAALHNRDDVPRWNGRSSPVDGDAYVPEVVFVESSGLRRGAAPEGKVNPGPYYRIQVGAFRDRKNADAAAAILERGGFSPRCEDHQGLIRVVVPAVEQKDLSRTRDRIKALGFNDLYVRP
jgi:hypothetical protein